MTAYVIAEAGVNHNGDVRLALELIDIAADAGADVVKFQTFVPEEVISRHAPKAEYQLTTTDAGETQLDMARKLWFPNNKFFDLAEHCRKRDITFLSTPFNLSSIDFLANEMNLETLKLPSGEITNGPFLLHAARTGCDIILSTGMATLDEIKDALSVLAFGLTKNKSLPTPENLRNCYESKIGRKALSRQVTLLHCTTEYPTPFKAANLKAMDTIRQTFGLPVGFSDHTPGINASVAAIARGAVVVEKHFTLDKEMDGPDHKASLSPLELSALVNAVKEVSQSLGNGVKTPHKVELKNIPIARKSLVASRSIKKGELFSEENLTVKRPGTGVSPMLYWKYLGTPACRDYTEDELISDNEDF
tara:strand:+ start:449 stop:1534 length:1086 start_codon:yes stop_codon:yes gene_type:complete